MRSTKFKKNSRNSSLWTCWHIMDILAWLCRFKVSHDHGMPHCDWSRLYTISTRILELSREFLTWVEPRSLLSVGLTWEKMNIVPVRSSESHRMCISNRPQWRWPIVYNAGHAQISFNVPECELCLKCHICHINAKVAIVSLVIRLLCVGGGGGGVGRFAN